MPVNHNIFYFFLTKLLFVFFFGSLCPLLSSSIGTIWCLFWLFYWQLFMYLTNTQRYLLTFFIQASKRYLLTFFIQASKRCLLTFSIFHFPYSLLKGKKKKKIFHTYMVFVRCTWHPLIPTHTFVKAHLWAYSLFMYLTKSTKRCLLAFFIQFTKKKNIFHTYVVFVGYTWHPWILTHTFVKAHLWAYSKSRKIIRYSRSTINAYSLLSHEWWVLPWI